MTWISELVFQANRNLSPVFSYKCSPLSSWFVRSLYVCSFHFILLRLTPVHFATENSHTFSIRQDHLITVRNHGTWKVRNFQVYWRGFKGWKSKARVSRASEADVLLGLDCLPRNDPLYPSGCHIDSVVHWFLQRGILPCHWCRGNVVEDKGVTLQRVVSWTLVNITRLKAASYTFLRLFWGSYSRRSPYTVPVLLKPRGPS